MDNVQNHNCCEIKKPGDFQKPGKRERNELRRYDAPFLFASSTSILITIIAASMSLPISAGCGCWYGAPLRHSL